MSASQLRLMCVLAHPDDESLGTGGTLASYAVEGVETHLITATRGERGRFGEMGHSPDRELVGRTRELELRAAAAELGLADVQLLDYPDGALDSVDPSQAIAKVAGHLRRVKPHVVITFGPDGAYGHADHIAISQLTGAAIVAAADPGFVSQPVIDEAHQVSKLYFIAWSATTWAAYEAALRSLVCTVDGVQRQATPWKDWAITTVIDTRHVAAAVQRAVSCHRTQMAIYKQFDRLSEEQQRALWGRQEFYRVFSLVNGGRARESDLFEGLR